MIPVAEKRSARGSLPGEEVKFSISEQDAEFIMDSLSDLYSDVMEGVIRELSTNALDSQVEAGVDEPIRITRPTPLSNQFVVEDSGTGMSKDVLMNVYTKYGYSTKRNSNDFNGLLGFGSKVPAAYASSFTIDSCHDGKRTVAVVTRNENDELTMNIAVEQDTDQRNGVKITVPVNESDISAFNEKIDNFFKFWTEGTVLINGETHKSWVGDKVDEGLYRIEDRGVNRLWGRNRGMSYVVMGGVAYPVRDAHELFGKGKSFDFVAFLENGAVAFTPNREALKYNARTKRRLQKIIDDFQSHAHKNYAKEMSKVDTHHEAFKIHKRWVELSGDIFGPLTFRGDVFNRAGNRYGALKVNLISAQYINDHCTFDIEKTHNYLVVENFPSDRASRTQRDKIRQWCSKHNRTDTSAVVIYHRVDSIWADPKNVVDWEDIKAEVAPPRVKGNTGPRKAVPLSFDVFRRGKYGATRVPDQHLPSNGEIVWVVAQEARQMHSTFRYTVLDMMDVNEIFIVPANRVEKFKRDNPNAIAWRDKAQSIIDSWLKGLTDDDKIALAYMRNGGNIWSRIGQDALDPDVRRVYNAIRNGQDAKKAYDRMLTLSQFTRSYNVHEKVGIDCVDLNERYPLVGNILGNPYTAILEYVNAVYQYRKDNEE